jgi:hypothetical protein
MGQNEQSGAGAHPETSETAAPLRSARPVELPRPTQDQQNYLAEMKRSTDHYDPSEIVGGPRTTRS